MKGKEVGINGIKNAQKNVEATYQQIQKNIEKQSEAISKMEFIGRSKDGNITAKFTGEKKAAAIEIKHDEMFKTMVEDGVLQKIDIKDEGNKKDLKNLVDALSTVLVYCINIAIDNVDKETDRRISAITKGMHIPGLN